jgi:thymidylate synthase (FAD)
LQGGHTGFVMTMNGRELRHFFSLRCCNRAQWEIRELADKMLELVKEVAPVMFADAGPGCVRGHCPEHKPCGRPRK